MMPASSLTVDPARLTLSLGREALFMSGRPGVRSPSSPFPTVILPGSLEPALPDTS